MDNECIHQLNVEVILGPALSYYILQKQVIFIICFQTALPLEKFCRNLLPGSLLWPLRSLELFT